MKFDISDNNLYEEGTKALAEALTGNQVMAELNISSSIGTTVALPKGGGQMAWVGAIADAIPTMGALTTLDVRNNQLTPANHHALVAAAKRQALRNDRRQCVRLLGVDVEEQFRDLLAALVALGDDAAALGPLPRDLKLAALAWL